MSAPRSLPSSSRLAHESRRSQQKQKRTDTDKKRASRSNGSRSSADRVNKKHGGKTTADARLNSIPLSAKKNYKIYPRDVDDVFSIYVGLRSGAVYERPEESGISHLLEHLVFNSHGKRVQQRLRDIGAQVNAYTSKDITVYYLTVNAKFWKEATHIIYDIVSVLDVSEADVEKEKKIVLQEKNETATPLETLILNDSFAGTPYEKSVIGTCATIESVTLQQLADYHNSRYVNNGCIVCAACPRRLTSLAERAVADLFGGYGRPCADPRFDYLQGRDAYCTENSCCSSKGKHSKCKVVCNPETETGINMNFRAFPYDRRRFIMTQLLLDFLVGGLSAPWYAQLREQQQYVYRLKAAAANVYEGAGVVSLRCVSRNDIVTVFSSLRDTITRTLKNGLFKSPNQFEDAKRSFMAKKRTEFDTGIQDSLDVLVRDAMYETDHDFLPSTDAFVDMLADVSQHEVEELCMNVFSHPLVIALGNNNSEERKKKDGGRQFAHRCAHAVKQYLHDAEAASTNFERKNKTNNKGNGKKDTETGLHAYVATVCAS